MVGLWRTIVGRAFLANSLCLVLNTYNVLSDEYDCPTSGDFISYDDSCYQFLWNKESGMSYDDANATCRSFDNGSLLNLHSDAEKNFIYDTVQSYVPWWGNWWLGFYWDNDGQLWKWDVSQVTKQDTSYMYAYINSTELISAQFSVYEYDPGKYATLFENDAGRGFYRRDMANVFNFICEIPAKLRKSSAAPSEGSNLAVMPAIMPAVITESTIPTTTIPTTTIPTTAVPTTTIPTSTIPTTAIPTTAAIPITTIHTSEVSPTSPIRIPTSSLTQMPSSSSSPPSSCLRSPCPDYTTCIPVNDTVYLCICNDEFMTGKHCEHLDTLAVCRRNPPCSGYPFMYCRNPFIEISECFCEEHIWFLRRLTYNIDNNCRLIYTDDADQGKNFLDYVLKYLAPLIGVYTGVVAVAAAVLACLTVYGEKKIELLHWNQIHMQNLKPPSFLRWLKAEFANKLSVKEKPMTILFHPQTDEEFHAMQISEWTFSAFKTHNPDLATLPVKNRAEKPESDQS